MTWRELIGEWGAEIGQYPWCDECRQDPDRLHMSTPHCDQSHEDFHRADTGNRQPLE